jgi:hypothetical protein
MTRREDLITPYYQDQMRLMHAQQPWGLSGQKYVSLVAAFYHEIGAQSLLDYGSGSETLRIGLEGRIETACYDPGVIGREALPSPADLVTCTDVAEHIQPHLIDNVLDHIFSLAKKGVFFSIALGASKQNLPDGTNAHPLVRSLSWWRAKLDRPGWRIDRVEDRGKQAIFWMVRE